MGKILLFNSFIREDKAKKSIVNNKEDFSNAIKEIKVYLYKTAFMYVKDEEKAIEVLQETITRAFINIKSLKEEAYFKTWITRILINVALDMKKEEKKNQELKEDMIFESNIYIEENIDLYKGVDLLRAEYKTVIIMKYFNDMKIKDIAVLMKIPESTVKTYLKRAKVNLKDILKEGYLDDQ